MSTTTTSITGKFRAVLKYVGQVIVVALIYFVAAKLGLRLAFLHVSATPVWPPTAIALSALLLLGYRMWPAIFLGAFFANLTTAGTPATSVGIALGNTLEALVGVYFVNRFAGGRAVFDKLSHIFAFTILAGFLSTVISATVGLTSLALGGFAPWADYPAIWMTWWLGDVTGNLLFAPFLVLWAVRPRLRLSIGRIIEGCLLLLVTIVAGRIIFGNLIPALSGYPLDFLIFPVIAWTAFRFEERETATIVVLFSLVAVEGTLHGFGPFVRTSPNEALVLLQVFMGANSIIGLALSRVVVERRHHEQRFSALVRYSYDATSVIDSRGIFQYVSPSTQRVLGYTYEELLHTSIFDLIHHDDQEEAIGLLSNLTKNPDMLARMEIRVLRKDKRWVWVESISRSAFHDPSIAGVVINYRDVTERKQAQEQLENYSAQISHENAQNEAILQSIGDGLIVCNHMGEIILVNKTAQEILGLSRDAIVGKKASEVAMPEREDGSLVPEEQFPIIQALRYGKSTTTSAFGENIFHVRKSNGSRFPAVITATPVRLEGVIIGAVKVFRDITAEHQIERAKDELISLVSHQLRTPLAVVKWSSEKILSSSIRSAAAKKYMPYIVDIHDNNQRMVDMVNAILNVARIEMGTFATEPVPVDVVSSVKVFLKDVKSMITTKKINVKEDFTHTLPPVLAGQNMVEAIVQNLISNAIKYTPPKGTITVRVMPAATDHYANAVMFSVEDTGYGIPKDQWPKIFTKLYRADNIKQKEPDGTGLGLYIVKRIVDQLEGKVWFESKENEGTTFYVILPVHTTTPVYAEPKPENNTRH